MVQVIMHYFFSLRFGHSMVQGIFEKFSLDGSRKTDDFPLHKNFFNLDQHANGGLDEVLAGLINQVPYDLRTRSQCKHCYP